MSESEKHKKKRPILKWIFRLVMAFFIFFAIGLLMMNAVNGTGETQKSSIENIIGDIFRGNGHIENFKRFAAMPYVTLEVENAYVEDREGNNKLLMTADYINFQTGLINILARRPSLRAFEIKNFYAAPGTLAPKAIIIDYLKPVEGENKLEIKGQYSALPFKMRFDVTPHVPELGLAHGYKFSSDFALNAKIDDLNLAATVSKARDGFHFNDAIIKQQDQELMRGKIQLALHHISSLLTDLTIEGAHFESDLHFDTGKSTDTARNLKGNIKLKDLELTALSNEDAALNKSISAMRAIAQKLNAPIDPIYSDSDKAEAPKTALPNLELDIKIKAIGLQVKGAILGDITLPITNKDGQFKVKPISGDINSGKLNGFITVAAKDNEKIDFSHELSLKQWDFGSFLTELAVNQTDIQGTGNIESKLTAENTETAELIEHMTGDFSFIVSDADMKGGILNKIIPGLVNAIVPNFNPEERSHINCMVADFNIGEGKAEAETLFIDARQIQIIGSGHIDLAEKKYAMKLNPEPKRASPLDVTPSLKVGGPLNAPRFSPDIISLGSKVGGALAGIVNPVLLAATLTDFGFSKSHPCHEFIAQDQE